MPRATRAGVLLVGIVTVAAGCSAPLTTREKGALTGGAIGAGTGVIIGSQVGRPGAGAIVGAGIGAISGAVIGDAIQSSEQKAAQPPPPPPAAVAPPPQHVAVAAPPPVIVSGAPRLIWVPRWGMYVMDGYDIVYYNSAYYYFHGGHWWIAHAHTGPWAVVATAPPSIAKLPRGRLRAHMPGRKGCPPGLAKQGRC